MNHLDDHLRHLLNVAKDTDNPSDYELKLNKLRVLRRVGVKIVIPSLISTTSASTAAAKATAMTTGTVSAIAVNTGAAVGTATTHSLWGWLSIGIFLGFGAATTASLSGDENVAQHPVSKQAPTTERRGPSRVIVPNSVSSAPFTTPTTTIPSNESQVSSHEVRLPSDSTTAKTKSSSHPSNDSLTNTAQFRIGSPSSENNDEHTVPESVVDASGVAPTQGVSANAHDELTEVLSALSQAQRLLAEGRAKDAIAQLDLVATVHPNGVMEEERRALRIIALCRAGESSSQQMARSFLEENPSFPMAPRVRQACGF
jgi:hypothetical protein